MWQSSPLGPTGCRSCNRCNRTAKGEICRISAHFAEIKAHTGRGVPRQPSLLRLMPVVSNQAPSAFIIHKVEDDSGCHPCC